MTRRSAARRLPLDRVGDQLPAIVSAVQDMLGTHEEIDQSQTLMVNFNAFAASSLDFFVYCFTRTTNWVKYHGVKQDELFKISEIVAAHGAEVALPTSTLHVPDGLRIYPDGEATRSRGQENGQG